jgi:hypothetical protein
VPLRVAIRDPKGRAVRVEWDAEGGGGAGALDEERAAGQQVVRLGRVAERAAEDDLARVAVVAGEQQQRIAGAAVAPRDELAVAQVAAHVRRAAGPLHHVRDEALVAGVRRALVGERGVRAERDRGARADAAAQHDDAGRAGGERLSRIGARRRGRRTAGRIAARCGARR